MVLEAASIVSLSNNGSNDHLILQSLTVCIYSYKDVPMPVQPAQLRMSGYQNLPHSAVPMPQITHATTLVSKVC